MGNISIGMVVCEAGGADIESAHIYYSVAQAKWNSKSRGLNRGGIAERSLMYRKRKRKKSEVTLGDACDRVVVYETGTKDHGIGSSGSRSFRALDVWLVGRRIYLCSRTRPTDPPYSLTHSASSICF